MEITKYEKYGSHLPVLKAVSENIVVNRAVELGCGFASTLLFLDREMFPNLTSLYSYESSERWIKRMRVRVCKKGNNQRWQTIHLKKVTQLKGMKKLLPDVILVDGFAKARMFVCQRLNQLDAIYVIHDTNLGKYEKVVKRNFGYCQFFEPPLDVPSTAIASNVININSINWEINWGL